MKVLKRSGKATDTGEESTKKYTGMKKTMQLGRTRADARDEIFFCGANVTQLGQKKMNIKQIRIV